MKREFMVERQGRSFVLYAGLLDEAHTQGLKAIRTQLLQVPSPDNGQVAICFAEVSTERGTFTGLGDASPDNVSRMMLPHILRMAETRAKARALRDAVNVGVAALEELAEIEEADAGENARHSARPTEVPHVEEAPRQRHAPASPTFGAVAPRPANFAAPARASVPPPAAGGPPPANSNAPTGGPSNGYANGNGHANGNSAFGNSGVATADPVLASQAQVRAIYAITKSQLGLTDAEIEEKSMALFGAKPDDLTKKQASDFITALKNGEVAGKSNS